MSRLQTNGLRQGAGRWGALAPLVARERLFAARMARRPATSFLYEFTRFGVKQAWACLFGAIILALLLATHAYYPRGAPLARYDFLFLAALTTQVMLLRLGMETWEEAKIIAIYHVVGTAMEVFKTHVGSWTYPEPCFFRIEGVPLFSGFMYASIGSYLARIWRLMDFRFTHHPRLPALAALSLAIYVNFFAHHYLPDARWLLFAAAGVLFWRTRIHYRVWRRWRSMPLLLGLCLVTLFIWLGENVGTFSATWLYPHQAAGWSIVHAGKFGSWFLLLLVSYTLVASVHLIDDRRLADGTRPFAT
ncbi:MAG TPA: DUF817 domain-containing protein [Acidisphaera sp.]|nr:DUF817 domain-containing protein [Acidisphaera sp.]